MIISRFNFPDELFNNTLIEGEMIKNNNNKSIFLINDIYIHKGISLNNKYLMKRLDILKHIFNNYQNDIDDVCLFEINKYFTYDKFNYLINDYKNSLNYYLEEYTLNHSTLNLKIFFITSMIASYVKFKN